MSAGTPVLIRVTVIPSPGNETQTRSCPRAPRVPPAAAAAATWMQWWSSTCACEAAPAMGHVLCSSRSPPCCPQGDSTPALPVPIGSLCPRHPGEGSVGDQMGGAFPMGRAPLGLGMSPPKGAAIPVPRVGAGLARGCPNGCEQSPWAALAPAAFSQRQPLRLLVSPWGGIAGAWRLPLCWGAETWEA